MLGALTVSEWCRQDGQRQILLRLFVAGACCRGGRGACKRSKTWQGFTRYVQLSRLASPCRASASQRCSSLATPTSRCDPTAADVVRLLRNQTQGLTPLSGVAHDVLLGMGRTPWGFQEGDTVHGFFPWRRIQEYPGEHCRKLDLSMTPGFSPSVYLGVLGLTGLSAYFPVVDIAKPVEGDTGE